MIGALSFGTIVAEQSGCSECCGFVTGACGCVRACVCVCASIEPLDKGENVPFQPWVILVPKLERILLANF